MKIQHEVLLGWVNLDFHFYFIQQIFSYPKHFKIYYVSPNSDFRGGEGGFFRQKEGKMAKNIFQEENGKNSATRVVFVLWGLGVLFVWILVSIGQQSLQTLDQSIIYILGILMTGKVGQKYFEESPQAGTATGP